MLMEKMTSFFYSIFNHSSMQCLGNIFYKGSHSNLFWLCRPKGHILCLCSMKVAIDIM